MKVFYNKNKLLYNLELFLVYILSYMVDYTRKHLNVLWLTETLAEQIGLPLSGRPILLIRSMITDRIWLHSVLLPLFTTPIFKSLVVPVIWLAGIDVIYSWIARFFALNRIFFPANEEATLKTKRPIRFQGLFFLQDRPERFKLSWEFGQSIYWSSCWHSKNMCWGTIAT